MIQSDYPQKIRETPRFALNDFVKYLDAKPADREKLVRKQKYPPDFMVIYYEFACNSISRFIVDGMEDQSIIVREIDRIRQLSPKSENESRKYENNIEALTTFLSYCDEVQFGNLDATHGPNELPVITIEGVQVSVNPDIVLRGTHRGNKVIGGVRLYFAKTDSLNEEMASSGAALVVKHFQELVGETTKVRPPDCKIFDVFAGRIHEAPVAITRRMDQINAACREIARFWPHA